MRNTCRLTSLLVIQGKCFYASTVEQCVLCNMTPHTCLRGEVRARNILQMRLVWVDVAEQWDAQSSEITEPCRWGQLHRDRLWPLRPPARANPYGTSHWGTGPTSHATSGKKHFVMATVQLFGCDIVPIRFHHRQHWVLYIEIQVPSHLAFYFISPLTSPWRLPIHRDIYSESRRSLNAKTLLCPRLGHRRDEVEIKVTSPKVLHSISNQIFKLVRNCAKDQDLTILLWWEMDRKG